MKKFCWRLIVVRRQLLRHSEFNIHYSIFKKNTLIIKSSDIFSDFSVLYLNFLFNCSECKLLSYRSSQMNWYVYFTLTIFSSYGIHAVVISIRTNRASAQTIEVSWAKALFCIGLFRLRHKCRSYLLCWLIIILNLSLTSVSDAVI